MKKRSQIEAVADFGFIIFVVTEAVFAHSRVGQLGLIFFFCTSFLLCLSKMKIKSNIFFFFSGIFILYNWLNIQVGISTVPDASMDLIWTLLINIISLVLLYNYVVLRNDPKRVIRNFTFAVLCITGWVMALSMPSLLRGRLDSAAGINANVLAFVSSNALLMTLYLRITDKKTSYNLILIWFLMSTLLTGSRKGILIIALGVVILMLLMFPQKRTRNLLLVCLGSILLWVSIMRVPILYQIVGIRVEALMDLVQGGNIEEASLRSRYNFISQGWEYFLRNPWRGHGLDAFRYIRGYRHVYSHNNFIELLVSGGIIGFAIYYVNYLIILLRTFNEGKKGNSLAKLMFAIAVVMLVMDYAVVSYYGRLYQALLVLTIGFTRISKVQRKRNLDTNFATGENGS